MQREDPPGVLSNIKILSDRPHMIKWVKGPLLIEQGLDDKGIPSMYRVFIPGQNQKSHMQSENVIKAAKG